MHKDTLAHRRTRGTMSGWFEVAVLGALLLVGGCEDRHAVPDEEAEDAGQVDQAVADAGPGWSDGPLPPIVSTCPNQRGMVGVPFPDGTCYLMDPWPVTRGEYLKALEAGPLASASGVCRDQSPAEGPRSDDFLLAGELGIFCAVTYYDEPESGVHRSVDNRMRWPPSESEIQEPMVCVTWCDALAYCERVGKRLCGNRALTVDSEFDTARLQNANHDEFYNACTGGGSRLSPTGEALPTLGQNRVGNGQYRPLQRAQLEEAGEGAFLGIFGLRVSQEWSAPVYQSYWTDYVAATGGPNSIRRCTTLSMERWALIQEYRSSEPAFGGMGTIRCCADPGAEE